MDQSEKKTAVLLIAHGSRRSAANQELVDLAERLVGQLNYSIIEPSFLELADPDIVTGGSICVSKGAEIVLMVPYFLSAGVHIQRDLSEARDELSQKYPGVDFRLGPPLGPHPLLDELVIRRIGDLNSISERMYTDEILRNPEF
jgi:sirohydrochlorin ferrochelatase